MANLTYQSAVNLARQFVKQVPITAVDSEIVQMVAARIWNAWPWEWSQASLTPISLVDGQQDYAISNADFFRPINLVITRTDLTPNDYIELKIVERLPPELKRKVGWPNFRVISYEVAIAKLRLEFPPEISGGTAMRIDGDYQKKLTTVDDPGLSASMPQPDHYFQVIVAGIMYYFYLFSDDPRAGNVVVNQSGRKQYTGQLGVWNDLLREMMAAEDYKNGQAIEFPEESLGTGVRSTANWIYGP